MTYSNDKNQKTPNVSQISKTQNTVSCAAKYDPKGGETRILVLTVRMKIESCFLFWTDKEKTNWLHDKPLIEKRSYNVTREIWRTEFKIVSF